MDKNWKSQLAAAVRQKIKELRADGTVSIGADCLFQLLRFPPNGPVGTNCRWVARQVFNEVRAELPRADRNFIYDWPAGHGVTP